MTPVVVAGDLLDQSVDAIVNTWNRNVIPWWLLIPQGVSGAIKRRGGNQPFRELNSMGSIPLGGAALTSAGRLPFKGIIHVSGISLIWRASAGSIQRSVRSAMQVVDDNQFASVAFPVIGAGSGGFRESAALDIMLDTFRAIDSAASVRIVLFRPPGAAELPTAD